MLETKGSKVRYTDVVKERRSQDMGEGKAHESDHKFPLCKICHFTQGNADDEDEVEGGGRCLSNNLKICIWVIYFDSCWLTSVVGSLTTYALVELLEAALASKGCGYCACQYRDTHGKLLEECQS